MKKRSSAAVVLILIIVLIAGLSLLFYPTISDLWNSWHQSEVVVTYAETVSGMTEEEKDEWLDAARAYNKALAKKAPHWVLSDAERADYESQLDITGTGVMGYVEIPEINISLPIYHGMGESVLQEAIGHIEGSSLPVGGENTHAVISGHRGLPSARLFTDIDRLESGDIFYIHVIEETLAYEVDQILTVEPEDLEALEIQKGQDYCTLMTCTPYGINSHRLLIRGHRIDITDDELEKIKGQEPKADNTFFLFLAGIGAALIVVILFLIIIRRKRKKTQT